MRGLMTGMRSEKRVFRRFGRCANVIECTYTNLSGFAGLEVACWPLVPKFACSNPAEAVGFFRAKKSSAHLSSEGK